METDIGQPADRTIAIAHNHNGLACQFAGCVIARRGQTVRTADAVPVLRKNVLKFLTVEFLRCINSFDITFLNSLLSWSSSFVLCSGESCGLSFGEA